MNSGNSCKNLCVRVRVCVCAQQNVSSVRGEGSGAEKRGENWKCSPHHSGSVLLFDPRAELGAGEGPCVGTRDTATCRSCSGRRLLLARCRRLGPAVVTPRTQNHVQNSVPEHWLGAGAGGAAGRGMFSPRTSRFPAARGFPGSSRLRLSPGPAIPASGPAPSCSAWALLGPMPRALPALPRWLQPLPVEIPPLPLSWQLVGVQRLHS